MTIIHIINIATKFDFQIYYPLFKWTMFDLIENKLFKHTFLFLITEHSNVENTDSSQH